MSHFSSSMIKARTTHRCNLCARRIDPGEVYRRGAGMDGSSAWTWKECAHCAVLATFVCRSDGNLIDDEYGPDLFDDWEPTTLAHLRLKVLANRRSWRHADGTLYPVPQLQRRTGEHGFSHITGIDLGAEEPASASHEPACPDCDVELDWRDGWGYRCPSCKAFVCLPRQGTACSTAIDDLERGAPLPTGTSPRG